MQITWELCTGWPRDFLRSLKCPRYRRIDDLWLSDCKKCQQLFSKCLTKEHQILMKLSYQRLARALIVLHFYLSIKQEHRRSQNRPPIWGICYRWSSSSTKLHQPSFLLISMLWSWRESIAGHCCSFLTIRSRNLERAWTSFRNFCFFIQSFWKCTSHFSEKRRQKMTC